METYTAADALIESLHSAGVSYIFTNLGTDHPALIESWAKSSVNHLPMPEIIICPHETVALSAALGYAQVTGRAQAVIVHVDVGTQNLGGAVHNAARGRVPVFIFAGASSFTIEGELPASRTDYIQFIQDVYDQRGVVRGYTKWDYEIKTGKNVQKLVHRAMQIANSEPKGPVYLVGAREVLEEESIKLPTDLTKWNPISPAALSQADVKKIAEACMEAKNPLVITSYLGRNAPAVDELVAFSERLAIPVVEVSPSYMNFPSSNPLHLGFSRNAYIDEADVVIVIDCDLPWIPLKGGPRDTARVFYMDVDPLKQDLPLWYIPSEQFYQVNSLVALQQLNQFLSGAQLNRSGIEVRRQRVSQEHARLRDTWKREVTTPSEVITPEYLTACLAELIDDDTVVINETCAKNAVAVTHHLARNQPGTLVTSGGSSLGWGGGAAIGAKLAHPDKTVVCVTGDGAFIFSCPTAVYWASRRYNAPFLTIIYNNQGWEAPRQATLRVHPDGVSRQHNRYWNDFEPGAALDSVAHAAGGALAIPVVQVCEVKDAIRRGLEAVKNGTSAVVNVMLEPVSTTV